jgi:hypothetical protein
MPTRSKGKKKFSGFSKPEAFQLLNLKELTPWEIKVEPAMLSDFFVQHLQRLRRNFDLEGYHGDPAGDRQGSHRIRPAPIQHYPRPSGGLGRRGDAVGRGRYSVADLARQARASIGFAMRI